MIPMGKFLIILSALVVMGFMMTGEATVYTVGGAAGWDISADFPSWVSNKTFYVGDVLVFQYNKYHTINEVDKPGYDNCTTAATLMSESSGNTTVSLTAPGQKYFICGVLTHCLGGMKLSINIHTNGTTTTTTTSPVNGAPVGAPVSPQLNPQPGNLSPGTTNSDGDLDNLLPPFVSRSSQLGKGCGMAVSWMFTLGTLLMALAAVGL